MRFSTNFIPRSVALLAASMVMEAQSTHVDIYAACCDDNSCGDSYEDECVDPNGFSPISYEFKPIPFKGTGSLPPHLLCPKVCEELNNLTPSGTPEISCDDDTGPNGGQLRMFLTNAEFDCPAIVEALNNLTPSGTEELVCLHRDSYSKFGTADDNGESNSKAACALTRLYHPTYDGEDCPPLPPTPPPTPAPTPAPTPPPTPAPTPPAPTPQPAPGTVSTSLSGPVTPGATTLAVADIAGINVGDTLTLSDGTNSETSAVTAVTADNAVRQRRATSGTVSVAVAFTNGYAAASTVTITSDGASGSGDFDAAVDTSSTFEYHDAPIFGLLVFVVLTFFFTLLTTSLVTACRTNGVEEGADSADGASL